MKKLFGYAKQIGQLFKRCALSAYAGQTAFFLMLSFFPFLLFCFAILRVTPLTEDNFTQFLLAVVPLSFRDFLGNLIHDIYATSNTKLLSITIISAVWLSSKAFLALIQGLNSMYQCSESRNFIVLRFFSAIYSVIFAILIIITLFILVFGNWIHSHIINSFPLLEGISMYIINLRLIIAIFILLCFFVLLYRVLPNCKWKLYYQLPGALLSTAGWLALSYLYSFYVDSISNYSSFYGTMTTIALLMIWLYACMYLLFLGGILNHFLKNRY